MGSNTETYCTLLKITCVGCTGLGRGTRPLFTLHLFLLALLWNHSLTVVDALCESNDEQKKKSTPIKATSKGHYKVKSALVRSRVYIQISNGFIRAC